MNPSREQSPLESCGIEPINSGWVSVCNRLVKRRIKFVTSDGITNTVEFTAPGRTEAVALARFRSGSTVFAVRLSRPSTLPALDIALNPELPEAIWLVAVREALKAWMELASELSGTQVTLLDISRKPGQTPLNGSLGVCLSRAGIENSQTIDVHADLEGWRWILSRLNTTSESFAHLNPMLVLCFRLSPVRVPVRELRELQLGDVILLDETASTLVSEPLTCVMEGQTVYGLKVFSDGNVIHLSNDKLEGLTLERDPDLNPGSSQTSPKAGDVDDALSPQGPDPLDALEMRLQFEVGRAKMSLAQVRALTPGQVLVAAGDNSVQDVRVLCNGRWIATGRLVDIGKRLGVQVTDIGGLESAGNSDTEDLSQELQSGGADSLPAIDTGTQGSAPLAPGVKRPAGGSPPT